MGIILLAALGVGCSRPLTTATHDKPLWTLDLTNVPSYQTTSRGTYLEEQQIVFLDDAHIVLALLFRAPHESASLTKTLALLISKNGTVTNTQELSPFIGRPTVGA